MREALLRTLLSMGDGGVSGTASLSCSGAPKGSTCALPSTVNVDAATPATFKLTVSTTLRTMAVLATPQSGWLWATGILALAVLPCSQKKTKRYLPLVLVVASLLPSCGGGSSGPSQNSNGTPAGTYNLTVTATMGSNTQATSLTLTVQ